MRYALELTFDGTRYHGWQRQENANTVQQELETALRTLLKTPVETTGCGRTDTGVHARIFVAHFDFNKALTEKTVFQLNSILPYDIAVNSIRETTPDFHARFSAVYREYAYYVHFKKNPFLQSKSWHINGKPDFEVMNQAAKLLLGKKSFRCFCKGQAPNDSYICTVEYAEWKWDKNTAVFRIRADRFLRNMVRAATGTLIKTGSGKMNLEEFENLLDSGTRSDAGKSVPAWGLYLENVQYKEDLTAATDS